MAQNDKQRQWLGSAFLLEETSNLWFERFSIAISILALSSFIWWATVTPIDELASASGDLIPESNIVMLQAGIGGIIQKICVKDGDQTTKGDVLIEFKTDDLGEELQRLKIQRVTVVDELSSLKHEIRIRKKLSSKGLYPALNILQLKTRRQELRHKLQEIDESSAFKKNLLRNAKILSPTSGLIQNIKIPHIGASVRAGEALMDIVPTGGDVIADIKIKPVDIGHVKVGQSVAVRVSTFESTRYGTVLGHISSLSPSSLLGRDGVPYFKGRVVLQQQFVGKNHEKKQDLSPGMTVDADIKIGRKTIIEYLLKPIFSSAESALHER